MDDRVVGKLNESGVFRVDSSTSGAVKRSRTASSGIQGASCLVDGCNSDLSKCRDYHRRHKVCELHSKTPKVTVKGQEQRFCQQCSRFHSLEEFDEGKRSCRKRLDGHNRRRRKPQPETLAMNSGTFLAEYEGARFLAFDHGQVLPRVPVLSSAWAENGYVPFNSQSQLKFDGRNGSIRESLCEQGERQLSFIQGSSQKAFSKGLNRVFDSDCALSLLSSTPAETREVGLRHIMQPNAISPAGSFIPLDGLGMMGDNTNTNTNTNTNLNCQGMFHFGSDDGSSSSLAHQKLFSWE